MSSHSKFAVIARDPQVDLYHEDDLYGVEIVEGEDEDDAIRSSEFRELQGLQVTASECVADMKIGECELREIRYKD